ncbi:LCP family protein [Actinomadura kijaniata]|uniref:LCP family protein n=1 Tax=Actinomadura kijaniata TaxID=46161 RepID=UPI00082E8FA6|nr:LCP family protein [Actinomadura kijaniata]
MTRQTRPELSRTETGRLRRRRRRVRLLAVAVVVLGLVPLGVFAAYSGLDGGIAHVRADDLGPRPDKRTKAENILVVGSDSRAGANARYGRDEGARTDTMILFHVPADGRRVTGVSLPRDSMVQIPACTTAGGVVPARSGMINSAFNDAGLQCAWKTVEHVTGVRVDHAVQIDFTGFERMVDALGGVELDVAQDIRDDKAKLFLKKGRQRLDGERALGYARARYGVGDGSDLGRIQRQQALMRAMAATARQRLTEPAKVWAFLRAATGSVTTDQGFGLKQMFDLAMSVGDGGDVDFRTVPVHEYPGDRNRVQWTRPAADRLFASLR